MVKASLETLREHAANVDGQRFETIALQLGNLAAAASQLPELAQQIVDVPIDQIRGLLQNQCKRQL
jgi:hypothetical protein